MKNSMLTLLLAITTIIFKNNTNFKRALYFCYPALAYSPKNRALLLCNPNKISCACALTTSVHIRTYIDTR